MIFVTVGGQLPFDRLVDAVDRWAESHQSERVFAQIGSSKQPPRHIQWERFLSPSDFKERVSNASLVVSHAGIGTILTAIDLAKPIVVMPRRCALGEHRNDHQWATVSHLPADLGVAVARDERELLDRLESSDQYVKPAASQGAEHQRLLGFVRAFVRGV